MFEWWNSLGITMQVFYCIALPATLIIVIPVSYTHLTLPTKLEV